MKIKQIAIDYVLSGKFIDYNNVQWIRKEMEADSNYIEKIIKNIETHEWLETESDRLIDTVCGKCNVNFYDMKYNVRFISCDDYIIKNIIE